MAAHGMLTVLGVPASKALAPCSASSFSHSPFQASASSNCAAPAPASPCSSSESSSNPLSFSSSVSSGNGASSHSAGLRSLKLSRRSEAPGSSTREPGPNLRLPPGGHLSRSGRLARRHLQGPRPGREDSANICRQSEAGTRPTHTRWCGSTLQHGQHSQDEQELPRCILVPFL